MGQKDKEIDKSLAEDIIKYYGYFSEHSLMSVAKNCAKLMINEHFEGICSGVFKNPSHEEMEKWVLEEMKDRFDAAVVSLLDKRHPDWSEEQIDAEVARLEKMYEVEHEKQLKATTNAALKEVGNSVRKLQKEMRAMKRKYTT
jgi:hypothetical protein